MTSDLRQRLRTALRDRLKARDADSVAVLRSTLAEIDKAEAVLAPAQQAGQGDHQFAGSTAGLAAAETDRGHLSEAEIARIVSRDIADRRAAASEYDRGGRRDHGDRLRGEADLLAGLLARPSDEPK